MLNFHPSGLALFCDLWWPSYGANRGLRPVHSLAGPATAGRVVRAWCRGGGSPRKVTSAWSRSSSSAAATSTTSAAATSREPGLAGRGPGTSPVGRCRPEDLAVAQRDAPAGRPRSRLSPPGARPPPRRRRWVRARRAADPRARPPRWRPRRSPRVPPPRSRHMSCLNPLLHNHSSSFLQQGETIITQ